MSLLWVQASQGPEHPIYYHASPHLLAPGTVLRPGSEHGVNNFPGEGNGDNSKVFLSHDEDDAKEWGSVIGQQRGHDTVHIYKVHAPEATKQDHGFGGMHEYVAPQAHVLEHTTSIDPVAHARPWDHDEEDHW